MPPISCLVAMREHFPLKVRIRADRRSPDEVNVWSAAREWCHEQYGPCFNEDEAGNSNIRPMFAINRSAKWGTFGTSFFFEDDVIATMFRVTWG